MDQSIITQVARDENIVPDTGVGSINSTTTAGTSSSGSNGAVVGSGGRSGKLADQHLHEEEHPSAPVRRTGLLASILCCGCSQNEGENKDEAQKLEQPTTTTASSQQHPSSGTANGPSTNLFQSSIGQPSSNGVHLIGEARSEDRNKKCVVIDLDETLVHSSFIPVPNADFVIPVEIDGIIHQVYVLKRPYVDQFLSRMGELFECVLFTASLAKYADPVANLLDRTGCFRHRLFREACVYHKGNYVKDLSRIGREVCNTIIIDNSPASYIFHPQNAVPVGSWFDDPQDTELLELIPFFEGLTQVENCVEVLQQAYA